MSRFFTGQKINKKTEEVGRMKKTGLMLLLFLGIVIVPMLMPGLSFGWTTYNYSYRLDGTISARAEVQANGTVLGRTSYDTFRRNLIESGIQDGADRITTYTYNDFTGTSVGRTRVGDGDSVRETGELDQSTVYNAYRQALVTVDNASTGSWEVFSGRGTSGNTADYRAANNDGTVGIQVAGGEAAFQAMLAVGGATVGDFQDWVTSSGLEFDSYIGRRVVSVYAYNELGHSTTYNLSTVAVGGPPTTDEEGNPVPTPRPFSDASVGRTLFVSSFSTTGADGQPLSGRNYNRQEMTDIGKYTNKPHFDPIIQVSGVLGRGSDGNLTLTTSDGVTHNLLVGSALAERLTSSIGSNVTLVVDVLDDGRYSPMSVV